jgi:hypothetical protein
VHHVVVVLAGAGLAIVGDDEVLATDARPLHTVGLDRHVRGVVGEGVVESGETEL